MPLLPPLPGHRLEVAEETRPGKSGFLEIRKLSMRARFASGNVSEAFDYFCVDRASLDAVVIVPHFRNANGLHYVVLRSALRPPPFLRPLEIRPVPEKDSLGELWEVPAGLIETSEQTPEGIIRCARRELLEETGYDVPLSGIESLGASAFPCPGVIGERHFYFHAVVDPAKQRPPPEDGSVLERAARIESVLLDVALEACRHGEIEDAKTELALRRLAEL
jgi:ADP-ribose pyrophosphatase